VKAVILAGGLGTRLKSVVSDRAKPMAIIDGQPFIKYLIDFVKTTNINEIILCVGHLSKTVTNYFSNNDFGIKISFSYEKEPLGTGGAIKEAIKNFNIKNDFLMMNGDSLYLFDLNKFIIDHTEHNSIISLSLKEELKPYRYGSVELDSKRIIKFNEKREIEKGLINCGVYVVKPSVFNDIDLIKFSFEKEILEKYTKDYLINGFIYDGYFIDIGLPESYNQAQKEIKLELNKYIK
jgi:D-glycero-alpha-D-manno-heptose 1-phosphate guanylyltransferase